MAKPDSGLMSLADIPAAIGLLTRIPMRVDAGRAAARGAKAAWAYPLVGAGVAFLIAVPASALSGVLPSAFVAGLVLVALVVVTGALHEDGLADSADGLWGAWERARRLEIMKDSHIGSYGVIALVLSLGLRWLGLVALVEADLLIPALIAVAALSRGAMVSVMVALPHARDGGLSKTVGRPEVMTGAIAGGLALVLAGLCIGPFAAPVALVVGLGAFAAGRLARAKIGGQTGDILGATQQISEIAALVTLAALVA